ncbi:acyl-CoA dehydrogenase, C-terminal domain protein [Mycobacterium xenopi 3993]|nr:acyl-CoA dehydrogenase, C-terminal domain protein [Mycobacterium xenopi 3993]
MDSVGHLELSGVEVGGGRLVGGDEVADWLSLRAALGRSAFQLGVLDRGLQMTAEYARTREQFDRPIGSFQAVSQRLADGYIDVKGLRLTLTQAAWRVSEDLPADTEVATAAFWPLTLGIVWRTPSFTYTVVSESISTTRCTAISWPPSRRSSRWAVLPERCGGSAANWPTHPFN